MILFFFGFPPPKLYILYRYTEYLLSTVGIIKKNLYRNLEALNLGGKFYISSNGVNAYSTYLRVWRYKLNYVFFQHVTLSEWMNE